MSAREVSMTDSQQYLRMLHEKNRQEVPKVTSADYLELKKRKEEMGLPPRQRAPPKQKKPIRIDPEVLAKHMVYDEVIVPPEMQASYVEERKRLAAEEKRRKTMEEKRLNEPVTTKGSASSSQKSKTPSTSSRPKTAPSKAPAAKKPKVIKEMNLFGVPETKQKRAEPTVTRKKTSSAITTPRGGFSDDLPSIRKIGQPSSTTTATKSRSSTSTQKSTSLAPSRNVPSSVNNARPRPTATTQKSTSLVPSKKTTTIASKPSTSGKSAVPPPKRKAQVLEDDEEDEDEEDEYEYSDSDEGDSDRFIPPPSICLC